MTPVVPQTKTADVRSPTPPVLAAPAAAADAGPPPAWRVSIDRGGTFTDIVATAPDGRVVVLKVPTDTSVATETREDGAIAAIRRLTDAPAVGPIPATCVSHVRCGTTAATNALLERRGERSALLVTMGFADLLAIGTQERPDIFALDVRKTAPLPERVVEIPERVLADGTVRTPLDEGAVRAAAEELLRDGIRSVGVLFLHSYAHPEHERRAVAILRRVGIVHVFASHESAREIQAVPRGETTAADAYLTPVLRRSLTQFRLAFTAGVDVLFIRSDGGLCPASEARGPAAVLSGPAGGALAVARIATSMGLDAVIGFDMGGTSTDVCRCAPDPERRYETRVAGFRLRVPALRVHTVAAGGGSILRFDGRRMLVGPESAGAHPGPAGYGRGGPATLTDADAVLGRLLSSAFPATFGADGASSFDVEASRRAIAPLAAAAGLTVEDAAAGFVRIADECVAQAVREESVLRGYDVRTHALVAFGGAGPQHACAVAEALGVTKVVVPRHASVLSAWGIAGARRALEFVTPILRPLDRSAMEEIMVAWVDAGARADAALGGASRCLQTLVELRVRGSEAALAVTSRSDIASYERAFAEAHRLAYGFPPPPGAEIEVVNVRFRAEEQDPPPAPPNVARDADPIRVRLDLDSDRQIESVLGAGEVLEGPALAVSRTLTIYVAPGWRLATTVTGDLAMLHVAAVAPPRITAARDPVSLTLFANAFMSAAERMGAVLERTSHSTNIKERLDFSCALFDGDGRLVANAPHIPVHLGAMGESVRAIREARGADLREGDCFATNDPYRGGSHLPDITVVTPVLVVDGRATFFVANRAHHADVGGAVPGSMPPLSRTIDDEGVTIHDLLLVRDARLMEDEIRAAFTASPHPARALSERLFDLRAQAAANHEGAKLVRELCDLHGADVVAAYMTQVQDDGAAAMDEVLAQLPRGTHTADDTLDDGTPLRVSVTIGDGRAVIDFAGTGPRSPGNLNAPRAVTRAAVLYAFRTLVRRPIPLNEGCLRPLDIRIPEGSLLDPAPPAAIVGGNVETSQRIVDLVLRALGAQAGSQGTMNNVTFGTDTWTYYETLGGGTGAGPGFDGASAVQCHMTNTRITDVEVLERRRPVVVRSFSIRRGSGGAGATHGGDGLVREIEFLQPVRGGVLSEHRVHGANGMNGGEDGKPGRNSLLRGDVETVLPGRAEFAAEAGDVLRIETPGGGGCNRTG
ncbi:MAG: hydantoinase B/oxoprolinase family protein [Planctomycetes bacterium]|nr:hydantoinase B/oxoprolinase family protein [Planctomycetota bacterium]